QKEVDELGRKIGYAITAIILVVALTQFSFTTAEPVDILLVAITLAVAAVPEGLPAVVTLTLALGSKKMLKKDALVRRLPVVESLGSVDVIVTDKTGTLTEDLMTVKKIYFDHEEVEVKGSGTATDGSFRVAGEEIESEQLEEILECGLICNNAEKAPEDEEKEYYGDPTEVALLVSAAKAGVESQAERVRSIPFSSERKRMTVVTDDKTAYMKGAPEVVLERCDRILVNGEEQVLDEETRQEIKKKNEEFAGKALRVLGFARKSVEDPEEDKDDIENNMVFLGLQGMIDPPRDEVKDAVEDCRKAGIRVVMATGDNIETAKAIGKQIGFDPEGAMTGAEIDDLSHEKLCEKVEEAEVFARVSPAHKVKILKALQENGHNVAMTGDGVNDAPALKNSDVGIAMGVQGTDVAKQSSDMVLQDDNFVTIRDAIAKGRGIFDN
ncbi:MAG: cation-translocating P-type ATPase, partial [Candidatus Aenigmatarchaeota archaeon]